MTEFKHKGKPLSELDSDHLQSVIRFIERKAEEGWTVRTASGGHKDWDIDEKLLKGKTVLIHLNYQEYIKELLKRERKEHVVMFVKFKEYVPQIKTDEKSVDWFPNFKLAHNGYMEIA